MADNTAEVIELLPCPFCGQRLTVRDGSNPRGRCDTGGCWMSEQRIAVALDDPNQVAKWNTRAPSRNDEWVAVVKIGDLPKTETDCYFTTKQGAVEQWVYYPAPSHKAYAMENVIAWMPRTLPPPYEPR